MLIEFDGDMTLCDIEFNMSKVKVIKITFAKRGFPSLFWKLLYTRLILINIIWFDQLQFWNFFYVSIFNNDKTDERESPQEA